LREAVRGKIKGLRKEKTKQKKQKKEVSKQRAVALMSMIQERIETRKH